MKAYSSLAALAAVTFIPTAQAWYQELPSCLDSFDPFVYSGCYDNGEVIPGEPYALDTRTDLDASNGTPQKCMAHCKGEFLLYTKFFVGVSFLTYD
jgi:hypothetical protein